MKNVAIVGFGFMGGMHAQVYQQIPGVRIVAVAEALADKAREQQKKLGLSVPIYPDLKTMLAREDIDVIDICLPTDQHTAAALIAINAGKSVFLEKPLAISVKDGEAIVKAAKQKKVLFQVGHCIRFWPEYTAFVDFYKSGKAGKLKSLSLVRRSGRPAYSAGGWLLSAKRSLGALLDLHIHDTDFVHHLLGKPKAVTSSGTKDKHGWTHVFTHYDYPGVSVHAEGGWNYPSTWGFQMAFQAIFENAVVDFDSNASPTLKVTFENEKTKPLAFKNPGGKSSSGTGNISSLGGYYNELSYFLDCVEKNAKPAIATGEQAMRSLQTVFAELKSVETGKTVKLA
jgi:predicted dehydrogenase